MDVPCKDCPDRVAGCHSVCIWYKLHHEERVMLSKQRRKYYLANHLGERYYRRHIKLKQRLMRSKNYITGGKR